MSSYVVLVTGASHGIGLATAENLALHGYKVYATCRDPKKSDQLGKLAHTYPNLSVLQLDVDAEDSVNRAVASIWEKEKAIHAVVNNAGFGIYGPSETHTIDEIRHIFETNVVGVMRVNAAVVPIMRKQLRGRIINLGSVSGVVPSKNLAIYSASKAALETLSAIDACHLSQWNIKVVVVRPGPVVTDFEPRTSFGSRFSDRENPYEEMIDRYRKDWKSVMDGGQSPNAVAEVIRQAIEFDDPPHWINTSQAVSDLVGKHFVDTSGNSRIPVFSTPSCNVDTEANEAISGYFKSFEELAKSEKWAEILSLGSKAVETARAFKKAPEEAKICAQLTSSAFYLGEYDIALSYAARCHELAAAFVDPSLFIRALYLESAVYRALAPKNEDEHTQQETFCRAIKIAEEANAVYVAKSVNDVNLLGKIYFNLGAAHADNPKGDLDKAKECYAIALDCFSQVHAHDDIVRCNIRIGKILFLQGKHDEALQTIQVLRPKIPSERLTMHADYLEAQIRIALKDIPNALLIVQAGLARAKHLNAKEDEARLIALITILEDKRT